LAQVVATPEGPVEFIGLKRWTVQMIRDTMAVKAPGQPLGQCAEVLRQVGFVSASAVGMVDAAGPRTIVTVIEPQDSARVVLKPANDSAADRTAWRDAIEVFRTHNRAFQAALTAAERRRAGDAAAVRDAARRAGRDSAYVPRLWAFLNAHRRERDFRDAVRVLASDGNVANQALAAAILGGFMHRDRAWLVLMDAQRSGAAPVAATASQVLQAAAARSRDVDWTPAVPAIRHLLAGTNVYLLNPTLDVLTRTRVSPSLAATLLDAETSELLLAEVAAHEPRVRETAHAFLVQVSGRDLGYDAAAWSRWIAALH
jgi:hypothetical protein